jgi:hypothetical protein
MKELLAQHESNSKHKDSTVPVDAGKNVSVLQIIYDMPCCYTHIKSENGIGHLRALSPRFLMMMMMIYSHTFMKF